MRCRTCGYALWNLTQPRCPECGTDYDLRDYRFRAGAVAFACPHCGHLHGGMGERYLPADTQHAQCLKCGGDMLVWTMRVVPLTQDAQATTDMAVPWEDRTALGRVRAFRETYRLAMLHPIELGLRLRDVSSPAAAMSFTRILYLVMIVPILLLALLITASYLLEHWLYNPSPHLLPLLFSGTFTIILTLVALLWPWLVNWLCATAAHLLLLGTGPLRGERGLTAASLLYAQAPLMLAPIMVICGPAFLALPIWSLVSGVLILREAQGVSVGRAILACLLPPLLPLAAFILLMMS